MSKTELNYQSVKNDAKAMTARLTELGVTVSKSQVLEALASAYQFKNWHVMKDAIKQTSSAKVEEPKVEEFKVVTPLSLFVECYNTDEYAADVLGWVQIKLNQEFMDKLLRHQALAKEHGIRIDLEDEYPDNFGPEDGAAPIRYSRLVITDDSFWYELSNKYERGHNEFGSISIEFVKRLAQSANPAREDFEYFDVDASHFSAEQPYLLMFRGSANSLTDYLVDADILEFEAEE